MDLRTRGAWPRSFPARSELSRSSRITFSIRTLRKTSASPAARPSRLSPTSNSRGPPRRPSPSLAPFRHHNDPLITNPSMTIWSIWMTLVDEHDRRAVNCRSYPTHPRVCSLTPISSRSAGMSKRPVPPGRGARRHDRTRDAGTRDAILSLSQNLAHADTAVLAVARSFDARAAGML